MKVGHFAAVCAAGAALCGVACGAETAGRETKSEAKPAAKTAEAKKVEIAERFPSELEAPAKALAEKLVNGLAESLKSGDFAAFGAVQPKSARQFKPEAFAQMRDALSKRYGTLVSSEYFGRLDQTRVMDFLWKFTFERRNDSGVAARRQIICWVRTGAVNGEPIVAGFSFCFF